MRWLILAVICVGLFGCDPDFSKSEAAKFEFSEAVAEPSSGGTVELGTPIHLIFVASGVKPVDGQSLLGKLVLTDPSELLSQTLGIQAMHGTVVVKGEGTVASFEFEKTGDDHILELLVTPAKPGPLRFYVFASGGGYVRLRDALAFEYTIVPATQVNEQGVRNS